LPGPALSGTLNRMHRPSRIRVCGRRSKHADAPSAAVGSGGWSNRERACFAVRRGRRDERRVRARVERDAGDRDAETPASRASAEVGDRIRYTVVAPPRTTRTESAHTRAQTSRRVNHPAYGRRRSADGRVRGVWHTVTDRAEIMTTPRETRARNTRPCAGPAGARAGGGCDCACLSRVTPSDDDDDETLGGDDANRLFKSSNLHICREVHTTSDDEP
jgi:hypothetical protein